MCYCSCWFSTTQFKVESRNELPCAQGKTGRASLQAVRYFQKPILWAQFLYLPISRKALKSFMRTTVPHDWQRLHETSRNLLGKCVLDCMCISSTKIKYILTFPHLFGTVSQRCLGAVSQAAVLILPQTKLNSQVAHFAFFFKVDIVVSTVGLECVLLLSASLFSHYKSFDSPAYIKLNNISERKSMHCCQKWKMPGAVDSCCCFSC